MELVRTNGAEHWDKSENLGTYAELWVGRCLIERFGGPAACEGYINCTKIGHDHVFKKDGATYTYESKWDDQCGGNSLNIAVELQENKRGEWVNKGIVACRSTHWAHVTRAHTYLCDARQMRAAVVGKYPVVEGGNPKNMRLALVPVADALAWGFMEKLPGVDIKALAASNPNPIAAVRNFTAPPAQPSR